MIQEKSIRGLTPPGYTDFVDVYISSDLSQEETELVILHEKSHIRLDHYRRGYIIENKLGDKYNHKKRNIAVDLEIAKHMYTDKEELIITKPRSNISGGICKKHLAAYPDCEYAEQFYDMIPDNKEDQTHDGQYNIYDYDKLDEETKQKTKQKIKDIKEIIAEAKAQAEQDKEDKEQTQKNMTLQSKIKENIKIKPSLASEIDHIIGKQQRVSSYARPSRRRIEGLLKKGKKTKIKKSKVVIYVDRSGSFCPAKTNASEVKLNHILNKYRSRIDKDVLYFSDDLFTKDSNKIGGGTNYTAVYHDTVKRNPDISIVITDDDGCPELGVIKNCLVIPIGCSNTKFAQSVGAKEVI